MKILFVASEVYPLIKTGGLGDVAGALPVALHGLGEDVRVIMPAYPQVIDAVYSSYMSHADDPHPGLSLGDPFGVGEVRLYEATLPDTDVPLWLVDCPALYARTGNPYLQDNGEDWPDNHLRFALLAWAAAKCATRGNVTGWFPDVVHCNDWQSGLTPAYLHFWAGEAVRPRTVFTIHNLQYQGLFDPDILPQIGLPHEAFAIDGLEFYGQASFLKAGLYYSDTVTTVSPTYAKEIQTPEFGVGMDGLLAARSERLRGILNGIDKNVWNPETDPWLGHHYSRRKITPKDLNKADLQREMHLPVKKSAPLFGVVTRLTEQKGIDMIIDILPDILESGAQVVVLGTGEAKWESALKALDQEYDNLKVRIGYYEGLAHQITAGSDIFLMPSRFEPCGLTQMYALRYGSLPLVRHTGGLADTVIDCGEDGEGTGFVFGPTDSKVLLATAKRAMRLYGRKTDWRKAQRKAMGQDFGWDSASVVYKNLYKSMIEDAPVSLLNGVHNAVVS